MGGGGPMAADAAEEGGPARSVADLPFPKRVVFWGFALLVVLGVAFYLWWGLSFGVWIDNGVYAVVATLVLVGLSGMWLIMPNPPVAPPAQAPARPGN
jgi:hypothetical protein